MLLSLVLVGSFLANLTFSSATPYNPPQYCRRDACYSQAQSSQSHCSSYLQKTVTAGAQTRTITSTVSIQLTVTQPSTVVSLTTSTLLATETDATTTSRTETYSTTSTTTDSTTSTTVTTQSTTATAATVTIGGPSRRKLRDVRDKADRRSPAKPATTTAKKEAPRPPCPEACPNTSSFVSACSCLGVQPKTVTAPGPTTTVVKTVSTIDTETKQVTNTIFSTISTTTTATILSTATDVQSETTTETSTEFASTTTTSTAVVATTVTPTCSLSSTPTTLTQNGNFDANYQSSSSDSPWSLTGAALFLNSPQSAQSPPILVAIPVNAAQPSGSVSQVITGYTPGSKYILSTFFRPFTLSPIPTDSSVQQSCAFNVAWGNLNLFTRQYTASNGTQSGYSYVQFNSVSPPSGTSAALTISYSCPAGYIGTGQGTFYIDTVKISGSTVVCNPV